MEKKKWISPQILQLGVEETQGGTTFNLVVDGEPYQDENAIWNIKIGSS